MEDILDEIRSGAFAREWADEVASGKQRLQRLVDEAARHAMEEARRRALAAPAPPAMDGPDAGNALSKK